MAAVKVRKKDIQQAKRPDALLASASSVFDWLLKRRTMVLSALAAALALFAVGAYLSSRSKAHARVVGAELSSAIELSTRPVKGSPNAAEAKKTFPTDAAKEQAVSDALGKIEKAHPHSAAGHVAALALAHEAYEAGKYDDAIRDYQTYLKGGEGDLQLFADEGLGYAYEAKQDYPKALDAFGKLAALGLPGRAEYHKARLLQEEGKLDDARKAFEDVVASYGKEVVASDARSRLDLLNLPPPGQGGFEPPAAPATPAPAEKKGAGKPKRRAPHAAKKSASK